MKKKNYLALLLSALFVLPLSTFAAASVKVGVVDMEKAMTLVNKGKKAKSRLESSAKSRAAAIKGKESALQQMKAGFEQQMVAFSNEVKAQKAQEFQQQLQAEVISYQKLIKESSMKQQKEIMEATQPIIKELQDTIPGLVKAAQVDIVLEKNVGGLLFAAQKIDLTDKLVAAYNKKYK